MKNKFFKFSSVHVLIIGDLILDTFYYGRANRISPEAPVPIVNIEYIKYVPGGAANVAMNIASLGVRCHIGGITGQDHAANTLQQQLNEVGIRCAIHQTLNNDTIVKQRVIGNQQQLLRMDFEQRFDNNEWEALKSLIEPIISNTSIIILSDYNKGTLSNPQHWINLAKQHNVPVLVDPKGPDFMKYNGADLITPNMTEFEAIVGEIKSEVDLLTKAQNLIELLNVKALLITRSEHGMSLITKDRPKFHLPAIAKEVFDVTGAGDTVISTIAAALASGRSLQQAVTMANVAASISVSKLGMATVREHELQAEYQLYQSGNHTNHDFTNIVTLKELRIETKYAKQRGEKIVFTNGCFDILHAGHVSYLQQARALGDRLIVAINTDESVAKLKGVGRPINTTERRLAVLAALGAVDWVIPFKGDTPEYLLRKIKPDILVKGGDYDKENVIGWDIVEGYGGQVIVMGMISNCSTTMIIDKITGKYK
ncbi:MAG: bifunctional D-glycero-beta-D-manno-heptose-7-phosphate kinase/D-glycero-beta-D-manno-heptose 1-phosphate adenylyltransferase HldE [Piscirickettsiaceae bacterium]|nr:bifunctional D-glycero-beta-D-manno-heptose-7-phosphate kinase/D-glycero-beta-D-manno-heptose 1-phosphate adenylyltransferase HldE [Piscirickettsiaceae bacterium]